MVNINNEHDTLCTGIDLGTTNSVLATINEKMNGGIVSKVVEIPRAVDTYNTISGEPRLETVKRPTLPSCIYYRQENNYEPLVGDFAKRQYPLRPHLVAKSIKSQMGNQKAEGLSPDIPDKTPAEVSSRILKHLLKEASKIYRSEITDAVITVPANFDSAMCKATRDAAELAGIKTINSDGSERPVLLSEPNAVIYDLVNQIRNGEISSRILDLSEKKRVLVFDLGGGTLDITMHEIQRAEELKDVLKVDEIATNRYTQLGGDNFDNEIAKAMYKRYIKQFEMHPDVTAKLRQEENIIMPQLRVYAEHLKYDLNERCGEEYSSGWDDYEDEKSFATGGNMGSTGYAYDDTFTQSEIEEILSVFMAPELKFDDYKRIEQITDTENIIYPVLDVLHKASEKLGTDNVVVDEVIVNGGMSKFYMVTDRLKEFFGFEPIVALDPDQAVARGAAVYHYYLHKYEQMQDGMKKTGITGKSTQTEKEVVSTEDIAIQWGNNILNDSLYLGVKNGAVHKIIPTGAALPYHSEVMTGFSIEPGQNKIAIPVKSRNLDGSYRTIASGNISFKNNYKNGAFVAFSVYMGSNKVITMRAWTSSDADGNSKLEEGSVGIAIGGGGTVSKIKTKFTAPSGSRLLPKEEINRLLQLYRNYERCSMPQERSNIAKRITVCVNGICSAGNKDEFADAILSALSCTTYDNAKERLFVISRRIGETWTNLEKKQLATHCMDQISAVLNGLPVKGAKVNANIQAIYALSICADANQLTRLYVLHNTSRYRQACMYTHAKTKTGIDWLKEEFEKDIKHSSRGLSNHIQMSSYAIGMALRKDGGACVVSKKVETDVINKLCNVIKNGQLSANQLSCCILALGWICDQRQQVNGIDWVILNNVKRTIMGVDYFYDDDVVARCGKSRKVALKMINGEFLNAEEEEFLLTKLEVE